MALSLLTYRTSRTADLQMSSHQKGQEHGETPERMDITKSEKVFKSYKCTE